MNTTFTIDFRTARRVIYVIMAALMLFAASPLMIQHAAAAQLSTRSIQMSDSSASGGSITSGVGSGTNVTYQVAFTPATQAASMIIDFCTQDPILNDTCTAPTGMTAATGVTGVTGTLGGTGWTLTASAGQIKLADDGSSPHDIQAATAQVVNLTGITNTSTVGTFYARIYTYSNTTWGTYSSATSVGNFKDYGGIAMSTTNVITITARVQEQLTFCVTKADPATWTTNHDCSDSAVAAAPPAVTLGHGSPTAVLDANTVDTGSIFTQLSTNATHGAVINMRNSNTSCGGLSADNGATCAVPAQNGGSGAGASAIVMTSGHVAAFGLFVADSTLDTGGVGTITPAAAYHNASHVTVPTDVWYGMDTTTSGNNVTSTFGSTIASTTAPTYRVDNAYTFAATSALTTPAGIYAANLSMIATGTF